MGETYEDYLATQGHNTSESVDGQRCEKCGHGDGVVILSVCKRKNCYCTCTFPIAATDECLGCAAAHAGRTNFNHLHTCEESGRVSISPERVDAHADGMEHGSGKSMRPLDASHGPIATNEAGDDQNSNNAAQNSSGPRAESLVLRQRRVWRELKFRAFDTVKGAWIPGGYGFHILGEAMLLGGLFHDYRLLELNNIAIMQFTGISDRNGKDVYEGDVLKHHKYGGEHAVLWVADSTGFFVGEQSWPLTKLCTPHIEVVGNVYETHNATE